MECSKMKCFVITPIGGEHSEIRREINGVNKYALRPALIESFILSRWIYYK